MAGGGSPPLSPTPPPPPPPCLSDPAQAPISGFIREASFTFSGGWGAFKRTSNESLEFRHVFASADVCCASPLCLLLCVLLRVLYFGLAFTLPVPEAPSAADRHLLQIAFSWRSEGGSGGRVRGVRRRRVSMAPNPPPPSLPSAY